MSKTLAIAVRTFAWLGLSVCAALAGCRSSESASAAAPQGEGTTTSSAPASQPTTAPAEAVVPVTGNEALCDLGPVKPSSRHVIAYVVENPADRPLVFKAVKADCECVSAEDPPKQVAAHSSARVTMIYVAPKTPMDYASRLLVLTDDPARKLISLRVKSHPPAK